MYKVEKQQMSIEQVKYDEIRKNEEYILKHKSIGGIVIYTKYYSQPDLLRAYIHRIENKKGIYTLYQKIRKKE